MSFGSVDDVLLKNILPITTTNNMLKAMIRIIRTVGFLGISLTIGLVASATSLLLLSAAGMVMTIGVLVNCGEVL